IHANPTLPTKHINYMKSEPLKQVEHHTANADPMNITLTGSSHLECVRPTPNNGRRHSPDVSDLTATPIPRRRMPTPAAMPRGRFQCSMMPELSSFWPASPASEPVAVNTTVKPAMK